MLVHSPYLGPASWRPTEVELSAAGYRVQVPDLRASVRHEPCAASFVAATRAALDRVRGDVVLVGHSRAGPLLPAVAHDRPPLTAVLYVDATLPHPGSSWSEQAPPERVAAMRRLGASGRLPRWSDWWDPSAFEDLVPDAASRRTVIDDMPRVPAGFLDERMPDVEWRGPAGYLQLSEAYAAFADTARGLGWPVETCALDHLAIVTAPAQVASGIVTVLKDVLRGRTVVVPHGPAA